MSNDDELRKIARLPADDIVVRLVALRTKGKEDEVKKVLDFVPESKRKVVQKKLKATPPLSSTIFSSFEVLASPPTKSILLSLR